MYAFTMKKNYKLKHHHENYKFNQSRLLYHQQGVAPNFESNITRQVARLYISMTLIGQECIDPFGKLTN